MPIRPENRARYPANWREISARIRQRDGQRCKECGVYNHAWGWRDKAGDFRRVSKRTLRDTWPRDERFTRRPPFTIQSDNGPLRIIEIVLTVAHLDHQPENCSDENLAAMCQRCHLRYDQAHHAQTAYLTRRAGKARADLFMDDIPGHVLDSAGF